MIADDSTDLETLELVIDHVYKPCCHATNRGVLNILRYGVEVATQLIVDSPASCDDAIKHPFARIYVPVPVRRLACIVLEDLLWHLAETVCGTMRRSESR